jgi:hypothetical protein
MTGLAMNFVGHYFVVVASTILVRTGTFLVARSARHQKRPNQSVDSYIFKTGLDNLPDDCYI